MLGLRELREGQVITQRELSAKSGVSNKTISDIEQGKIRPHQSTLRRLAKALGVNPRELAEHLRRTPG